MDTLPSEPPLVGTSTYSLGRMVIPCETKTIDNNSLDVLTISYHADLSWLEAAMGLRVKSLRNKGLPFLLEMATERNKAMGNKIHGLWQQADGKVTPPILSVMVRNQEYKILRGLRVLSLVIPGPETIQQFINEIYKDLANNKNTLALDDEDKNQESESETNFDSPAKVRTNKKLCAPDVDLKAMVAKKVKDFSNDGDIKIIWNGSVNNWRLNEFQVKSGPGKNYTMKRFKGFANILRGNSVDLMDTALDNFLAEIQENPYAEDTSQGPQDSAAPGLHAGAAVQVGLPPGSMDTTLDNFLADSKENPHVEDTSQGP